MSRVQTSLTDDLRHLLRRFKFFLHKNHFSPQAQNRDKVCVVQEMLLMDENTGYDGLFAKCVECPFRIRCTTLRMMK